MSTTQSPIVYANGIGPDRAAVLADELGIRTMRQMLEHYPFAMWIKVVFPQWLG